MANRPRGSVLVAKKEKDLPREQLFYKSNAWLVWKPKEWISQKWSSIELGKERLVNKYKSPARQEQLF